MSDFKPYYLLHMQNIFKCKQIFLVRFVLVPSDAISLVQEIIWTQMPINKMFGCRIVHIDEEMLKTKLNCEKFSSFRFFEITGINLLNMQLSQQYLWRLRTLCRFCLVDCFPMYFWMLDTNLFKFGRRLFLGQNRTKNKKHNNIEWRIIRCAYLCIFGILK